MTTEPEWGPWIEHDGKGCPCVGQYMQAEVDRDSIINTGVDARMISPRLVEGIPRKNGTHKSWRWVDGFSRVIRYRIRKPRAMKLLQSIVENPPKQRIKEDA